MVHEVNIMINSCLFFITLNYGVCLLHMMFFFLIIVPSF
jgi:hypothetical protein